MGIAVLGPLQVEGHADALSPRDRVVLSALVVYARRPVSTEALADALWGNAPPASWAKVVYGCVWRLRKVLGAPAIDTVPSGYWLRLGDDELDHRVFERLVERGREALVEDDPARALFLLEEALGLWRGPALGELEEWEPGRVEAARLEGLRRDAEDLLVEAKIRTGQAAGVLEHTRALIAQAPLRERRWALLAIALYQSGRQGEALGTVQRARTMLAGELGLDPGPALVELERRLLNQDPSLSPDLVAGSSPDCPYRGLLPYDAEDAEVFFGREDDLAACLRRLRETGVLVVVGPSGAGKSSLVRAGVVASLMRAGTPVLVGRPGAHPLESLAGLKPRGRQTLVVDQAEEAVTLCDDQDERERFFTALATHVGAGGELVLTLRADHLGDLAPYPEIARILEDGLYLLGPMREPDLRRAIEAPAHGAGLRLEAGLVDLVILETVGEPAGLPMLSHVLRETWARREGSTLTVEGYKATGGIQHAVSQSAEQLYDAMDDTQRAQLRSLLLRLVVPTDAGDPVRTRVPRDKVAVDEVHARLVEQLVDARLVTIDGEAVQIAHEALVRVWPRLRAWLDDDLDGQRLLRHLAEAADAWQTMGRPDAELYRGPRLTRVREWRERTRPNLSDTETAFLGAAVDRSASELRDAQQRVRRERRTNRRLRGALSGVAVLAVCSLVTGVLAVHSSDRAEGERDRARAAADLAYARQAGAVALQHEDLSLSLLLALSALAVDDSARARDTLVGVLLRSPSLVSARVVGGTIVDLAVSPDGSALAMSTPREGEGLQLMDAETLEPLPFSDDIPASGIAFSPDSSLLAMAVNQWTGNEGTPARIDPQPVRLYDMPEGTPAELQLGGFPDGASVEYDLDFSADGRRLVAAVDRYDAVGLEVLDTTAMVWDLADPAQPVLEVRGLGEYPVLKLSPDGSQLYAAVTDTVVERPVRVYDVESGRLIDSLGLPSADTVTAGSGAVSPDGGSLVFSTGSEVLHVDTSTWRLTATGMRVEAGDSIGYLAYSHDGTRLAGATASDSLLVWDIASGGLAHPPGEFLGSGPFGFSADDRTMILGEADRVTLWDLTGERGPFSAGRASHPAGYDVSKPAPDGRTLVRSRAGRMWFIDDVTGRTTPARQVEPDDYHVWSPDSTRLLSWRDAGVLRLWDTTTGRQVAQHQLDGGVVPAFSPTGRQVFVNELHGESLLVLDAASLKPVRPPIALGEQALAVVPHPNDGSMLAFARDGGVLRVDPESGNVDDVAPPGTFPRARVWEAELSPDGSRLLAMNIDPENVEVQLVDTTTWERVGEAAPWNEESGTFDLSPDGTQFASADDAGITIVDVGTGRHATIPLPSPTPAVRIAYLPNSSRLLVAGIDGSTRTVDTRWESWATRACDIAGRNLTQDEWHEYYPHRAYEATCPQWPPNR